ncbi:hypothetical protein [Liquorilactobacillus mali]
MGLYILMFAIVLGVILLGFGISKIKQRQTVIGYILSIAPILVFGT